MAIPSPQVIEYTDNVPSDFAAMSAFAPLFDREADTVPADAGAQIPSVGQWLEPKRAPVAPPTLELQHLERFKTLMAGEGWPVHVARMLFDRLYAYDRIVLAHTSSNFDLRSLALDLFRIVQARGPRH